MRTISIVDDMCPANMDIIILVLVKFNANDSRLLRWTPCISREINSGK